jgi:hypothetical protein
MKRAVDAIDIEGALLILGTASLAIAASYIHPAGPFAVVGLVCLSLALVAGLSRRRSR